ncbi:carboxymuconolactone decarboxylase family protein [Nocardioides vastitatis]|uniref:Carboxymuconolactone decarboxylase family protein n=1 Tax=Nocardioides vastitatis TaxID=2568655 RepID=A0ABW0ZJK5_9ACTN|nr:hypothetical protein E7Z54_16085 [Nocardioides sp.]
MTRGALAQTLRELAILRTAALLGSEYELTQHRWLAADMDVDAGSVEAGPLARRAPPRPGDLRRRH